MLKLFVAVLAFAGFMSVSGIATAIAPPDVIAKINLGADFIVIGKVVSKQASNTPPHFNIKITHIIKGYKALHATDQINILMSSPSPKMPKGLVAHSQGVLPVKVEVGSLVVVYINHSESHPDYYKPVLEGLSVITVGRPLEIEKRHK